MSLHTSALEALQQSIIACRRCPRLVAWREQVAQEKRRSFLHEEYWGRAVPSFGDSSARLMIIGLAPAAHGANRTGRMFTGDRSGDWLYRALHKAGFANQPTSVHAEDDLTLSDAYITGVCHCAPPENKPLPEEMGNCRPYLLQELEHMPQIRVIVALGKIAFDAAWKAFTEELPAAEKPAGKRPQFGHGVEAVLPNGITLIGCYHPSQQNTFTGKLTEPMIDAVLTRARELTL